jgi:hypothetical protein
MITSRRCFVVLFGEEPTETDRQRFVDSVSACSDEPHSALEMRDGFDCEARKLFVRRFTFWSSSIVHRLDIQVVQMK